MTSNLKRFSTHGAVVALTVAGVIIGLGLLASLVSAFVGAIIFLVLLTGGAIVLKRAYLSSTPHLRSAKSRGMV